MPRSARTLPIISGRGILLLGRTPYEVGYDIASGDSLKSGKGSATAAPEIMRYAFSAGHANLKLEDGPTLSVLFVAHTAGSDTAYFEIGRSGV